MPLARSRAIFAADSCASAARLRVAASLFWQSASSSRVRANSASAATSSELLACSLARTVSSRRCIRFSASHLSRAAMLLLPAPAGPPAGTPSLLRDGVPLPPAPAWIADGLMVPDSCLSSCSCASACLNCERRRSASATASFLAPSICLKRSASGSVCSCSTAEPEAGASLMGPPHEPLMDSPLPGARIAASRAACTSLTSALICVKASRVACHLSRSAATATSTACCTISGEAPGGVGGSMGAAVNVFRASVRSDSCAASDSFAVSAASHRATAAARSERYRANSPAWRVASDSASPSWVARLSACDLLISSRCLSARTSVSSLVCRSWRALSREASLPSSSRSDAFASSLAESAAARADLSAFSLATRVISSRRSAIAVRMRESSLSFLRASARNCEGRRATGGSALGAICTGVG
eukprot:scaffold78070_cov23-Tisochrysis_lutea.AAC.2